MMHSRAWTGNSAIFVVGDETDYDGSQPSDNYYASTAGCCDSPYLPAGDPEISASWPGGVYGGGSTPMIVVSRQGPRHETDATPSNSYSRLLTIEEGFGLTKLGYTSDSEQVHSLWPLIAGRKTVGATTCSARVRPSSLTGSFHERVYRAVTICHEL